MNPFTSFKQVTILNLINNNFCGSLVMIIYSSYLNRVRIFPANWATADGVNIKHTLKNRKQC